MSIHSRTLRFLVWLKTTTKLSLEEVETSFLFNILILQAGNLKVVWFPHESTERTQKYTKHTAAVGTGCETPATPQILFLWVETSLWLSLISVPTRSIWWSPAAVWVEPCERTPTGWGGTESRTGSPHTGRRGWRGLLWRRSKPWWDLGPGGRWGPGGGPWCARTCLDRWRGSEEEERTKGLERRTRQRWKNKNSLRHYFNLNYNNFTY